MRLAMLEMITPLWAGAFRLEVLADEMVEASRELEDEASAQVLLGMSHRHRVEAMEVRGPYAGLLEHYAEQFGAA